ncbi:hypothetical protein J132_00164 [Termitomyces sp. J132]|nr:hypothetical protein J132_00164 [Termitomyces sp. J132]
MWEWSHWEVDYIHGFVKLTKCLLKTRNLDGICNACHDVAHEESLKHAIRKVWLRLYSGNYLDFMILMCGYGYNSNWQFEIFSAEFAGPSFRHLHCKEKDKETSDDEYVTNNNDMENCDTDNSDSEDVSNFLSSTNSQCGDHTLNKMSARALSHVAWFSALCDDLDTILLEAGFIETNYTIPSLHPLTTASAVLPTGRTHLYLDQKMGKILIAQLLGNQKAHQSGTTTKSQCVVKVSDKYALHKVLDVAVSPIDTSGPGSEKMTVKEVSHLLCIA